VLTFISRDIARKDFLPSSINDFTIATSISSSWTGNNFQLLRRSYNLTKLSNDG